MNFHNGQNMAASNNKVKMSSHGDWLGPGMFTREHVCACAWETHQLMEGVICPTLPGGRE